jgi:hypothetical protein
MILKQKALKNKEIIKHLMVALAIFVSIYLNASNPVNLFFAFDDTVCIEQVDTTEYEIIIMEPGFESWLIGNAFPKWYYTNNYYRNKNHFFVADWNNRAIQSMHELPFEQQIFYDPSVDYGLEINYKLYWFFKYMEHKYDIKFRGVGKDSF